MKTIIATICALLFVTAPTKTVYDFTMKDIDGKDKQIGLLFMTPHHKLTPLHTRVINLLDLQPVNVVNVKESTDNAPSRAFIIEPRNSS